MEESGRRSRKCHEKRVRHEWTGRHRYYRYRGSDVDRNHARGRTRNIVIARGYLVDVRYLHLLIVEKLLREEHVKGCKTVTNDFAEIRIF